VSTQTFREKATDDFYTWLRSLGDVEQLSAVELAELAWRECYRRDLRGAFEMMKPLAHPDLHVIAGALESNPVTP